MSRWVDLDACPCNKCLIKQDCISFYDGECDKYIKWKKGKDADPVKHGKWENVSEYDDLIYMCSVCRGEIMLEAGTPEENEYNYCPMCGAKMMEGVENGL